MTAGILVGFQDAVVQVRAPEPWIVDAASRVFRHMRVNMTEPSDVVDVRLVDGHHCIDGDDEAPAEDETPADVQRRVRYAVIRRIIDRHPQWMWIHAGAAARASGAVVFAGAWGKGKSTVVTSLCAGGWSFLTDDVAPIDPANRLVYPFPVAPTVRQGVGQQLDADGMRDLRKLEIDIEPGAISTGPAAVRGVVFPNYDWHGSNSLSRIPPGKAAVEFLSHCLNFGHHRGRAVQFVTGLFAEVPVFRLDFNSGEAAAGLVDQCPDFQ